MRARGSGSRGILVVTVLGVTVAAAGAWAQPPTVDPSEPQGTPQTPPGYESQAPAQTSAQAPAPTGTYPQQPGGQPYGYPAPAPPRHRVRVPYEPGMAVPPGGQVVSRTRLGLWIPGLAILGTFYLGTASAGSAISETSADPDRRDAADLLFIPVLGPFLYLSNATDAGTPWVVLDGIVQAAALTMFIVGITARKKYLVYYTEGPAGRPLAFMPSAAPGGLGMRVSF